MASAERIVCVLCGKGHITRQKREVAFRQWSDKGYIHCRATIPIDICDHCHANYSLEPALVNNEQRFHQPTTDGIVVPTPADCSSPIRYPAIRPWLTGTECNSIK